ncbi:MAG: pseudouridine synthase [Reichenbachiella sp.]
MNEGKGLEECFHKLDRGDIELPRQFTYPFFYAPHPLALMAVERLQNHLNTQQNWTHDFGIDHHLEGINIGKMMGVMIVKNPQGEIGHLSAFSGKLAESTDLPGFVPPLVEILNNGSFYRKGEEEVNVVNRELLSVESSSDYTLSKEGLATMLTISIPEIEAKKSTIKHAKQLRKEEREAAKDLTPDEFNSFDQKLKSQSTREHYEFKDLKRTWKKKIEEQKILVATFENQIDSIKKKRKKMSSDLQKQIFNKYQFLNQHGETKGLADIFEQTAFKIPPTGAGDCCAPKLLQYAYQHDLTPIAMAEFWWGQAPNSEVRKHGHFYPSCKGKCHPILSHMLIGLDVEKSPMESIDTSSKEIHTLYEDDFIAVIHKPHEFLSVPGKTNADSVQERMEKKYPESTGPLMVHRLDRATSGIMIIAKTKESHQILQDQFRTKHVRKKYIAILDGPLEGEEGIIDLPLRPDYEDRPRQLVCYEHGKTAKTLWRILERKDDITKVEFSPITGRTHQLRMHAAHPKGLNTAIVGDDLYGKTNKRMYLHAAYISFLHPMTKKQVEFNLDAGF